MALHRHPVAGALGWGGVLLTLFAYLFVSFGFIAGTGAVYQILNLTASVFIAIETYYKKDYQPFWLNIIWAAIAIVVLLRIIFIWTA